MQQQCVCRGCDGCTGQRICAARSDCGWPVKKRGAQAYLRLCFWCLGARGGGDGLALPALAAVGVGGASSSTPTQASPCATHAGGMPDFHCPGCNVYWNARRAHREGRKKSPEFAKRVSLLVQAQDHSAEGMMRPADSGIHPVQARDDWAEGMMSPADSGIHPVQAQDDSAEGMMSPAESGIHPPNPRKVVNHNKITPDWFWRASPQCMCFSEVWRGYPRFVCRGPRGHR